MADRRTPARKSSGAAVLSAEERAAMRETLRERRVAASRGAGASAEFEKDVLAKIAEMKEPDRSLAKRIHAIVKATAPELSSRTWYGMPAYTKDGKVVCFFQSGQKFKSRYATLGFQDSAKLDDGPMWATAFAITKLTSEVEGRIAELVKKAAT